MSKEKWSQDKRGQVEFTGDKLGKFILTPFIPGKFNLILVSYFVWTRYRM